MTTKITKVRRKNLAKDAYQVIRDRIYENRIKPGELINESLIAEELGISRTPVREAIKMLVSEDIVEVLNGVGTYVKPLTFKNIKDIFEVRKALEVIAAKTAIYRITESEIKELEEELLGIRQKFQNGNLTKEEFVDIDMKIHKLIFDKCENNYTKDIFEEMSLKIKQYQYISYESLNNSEQSISQHLELLNLLRSRELKKVTEYLEDHIEWSLRCFIMEGDFSLPSNNE